MKNWLITGVTAAGLMLTSTAMARVDLGMSIGVPGVIMGGPSYPAPIYVVPQPFYESPVYYYRPAPVYVAPPQVIYPGSVYYRNNYYRGGDRYWNGRGYDRDHNHGPDRRPRN